MPFSDTMNRHLIIVYSIVTCATSNVCAQMGVKGISDSVEVKISAATSECPQTAVFDLAHIFSSTEIQKLDSLLNQFGQSSHFWIVLVTLDTSLLLCDKLSEATANCGELLSISKEEPDNGLVIGISKDCRKIRIRNGPTVDNLLRNGEINQVIDRIFIPQFRKQEFYHGTLDGVKELIRLLRSKVQD